MTDKKQATYDDAKLVLRLYELRREPVMRQSRDSVAIHFWPERFEDVLAVMDWSHPINAAVRQVSSYWEMVYGMAKNGIVHAEYLMESNGEGLMVYAKVFPFLEQMRKEYSPTLYQNAQWVVENTENGRRLFERFRARLSQFKEAAAKVS